MHYAPDGSSQTFSEVATVESHDIPESDFAPPAGFKQVSLPEFIGVPKR